MAEFITPAEVLLHVGVKTPSAEETDWATLIASAINQGITQRLNGAAVTDPPPDELKVAARIASSEAYKRREAPFGQGGFDDAAAAEKLARDYLHQAKPIIDRYGAGPGIG